MLGGCIEANNNLGRLYIVEDQDYATAAALLIEGRNQLEEWSDDALCTNVEPSIIRYSLLKNLGWARLKQERHAEAEGYLQEAITLDNQLAAAYCLLAQVLEREDQMAQAQSTWSACLAFGIESNPDEDRWIYMAQQRLESTQPEPLQDGYE